jgi:hypothetical protein
LDNMDAIALTTELEAINEMLNAIGEGQVSSIDTGNADVQQCVRLLRDHSRKVQKRGWWFNTDAEYEITPDGNSNLILPANTLRVDPVGDDRWEKPWVQRGTKLYDPNDHTFVFTESVKVDLVLGLAWEELPQTARDYITACAGLEFTDTDMASEIRHTFTQRRKDEAWLELLKEDAEASDYNMFRDSTAGLEMARRRI